MINLLKIFTGGQDVAWIHEKNDQFLKISKIFVYAYQGDREEFKRELENNPQINRDVNQNIVEWIAYSSNADAIYQMFDSLKRRDEAEFNSNVKLFQQLPLIDIIKKSSFLGKQYHKDSADPVINIAFFIAGYLGDLEYLQKISREKPNFPLLQWALCGAAMAGEVRFIEHVLTEYKAQEKELLGPILQHSLTDRSPLLCALESTQIATLNYLFVRQRFPKETMVHAVLLNKPDSLKCLFDILESNFIPIEQELLQELLFTVVDPHRGEIRHEIIDLLLKNGADPLLTLEGENLKNFKGNKGFNALEIALLRRREETSKLLEHCKENPLLLARANQNQEYKGFKLIHFAAIVGNIEIVDRLIALGASASEPIKGAPGPYLELHPIDLAYEFGQTDLENHLLKIVYNQPQQENASDTKKGKGPTRLSLFGKISKKEQIPQLTLPEKRLDELLLENDAKAISKKIWIELQQNPSFLLQYCSPSDQTLKILKSVAQDKTLRQQKRLLREWGAAILRLEGGSQLFWKEAQDTFSEIFKPKNAPRKNAQIASGEEESLKKSLKRRALLTENSPQSIQSLLKEFVPSENFDWIETFDRLRNECKKSWKECKVKIQNEELLADCSEEFLSTYHELKIRSNSFLQKADQAKEAFKNPKTCILERLTERSFSIDPLKIEETVREHYVQVREHLLESKNERERELSEQLMYLQTDLLQTYAAMQIKKRERTLQLERNHYLEMPAPDEKFALKKRNAEESMNTVQSLWRERGDQLQRAQTVNELQAIDSNFRQEINKKFTRQKRAVASESSVIQELLKQQFANQEQMKELLNLVAIQQRTIEQLKQTPLPDADERLSASIKLLKEQIDEELSIFSPKDENERKIKKSFSKKKSPLKTIDGLIKNYKRMGYKELSREGGGSHRHFTCSNIDDAYQYITLANHTQEPIKAEIQTGLQATLAYLKKRTNVE